MQNEDETERLAEYRAGRLSANDRQDFEEKIANDRDTAAWNTIADGIRNAENVDEHSPGDFGWARLSRSIDAEARKVPRATLSSRTALWQVAAILVFGIALWQFAIVPVIYGDPEYVTASGDDRNVLKVKFVPTATEADIRALLRNSGARIVDGPSALGLYSVAPSDSATLRDLREALIARSDLVASATEP